MNARTLLLLYALTIVAGYVDAIAFFGLGVFTANMTGNTVLLGGALASSIVKPLNGSIGIALPALSLAAFAGGALVAAVCCREAAPGTRWPARAMLAAVALALAGAWVLQARAHGSLEVQIALLSAVMGAQSIVAVGLGVPGVSTTYVTGTLVHAVGTLAGTRRTAPAVPAEGWANAGIWGAYLAGAACGGVALRLLAAHALLPPAAVVALLLLVV